MSQHDTLLAAFETYKAENEKFIEKGIKASAARARKALQEIAGACKERRKEIPQGQRKIRSGAGKPWRGVGDLWRRRQGQGSHGEVWRRRWHVA